MSYNGSFLVSCFVSLGNRWYEKLDFRQFGKHGGMFSILWDSGKKKNSLPLEGLQNFGIDYRKYIPEEENLNAVKECSMGPWTLEFEL